MHDIDRALFEAMPNESGTYGEEEFFGEGEIYGEEESYGEGEEEFSGEGEIYGEESQENTGSIFGEWGSSGEEETYGEVDGQELALASELLALNSEEELDRFLGNLISGAITAAKNFASSDAGRAIGKILKDSARRALPHIGQAVGGYLSPDRGADVGKHLGRAAAASFETGLQTEGLSAEDRELVNARAFIRYARAAARNLARTPRNVPPAIAARRAALLAAQRYLPGLTRPSAGPSGASRSAQGSSRRNQGGRWVRRGRNIVLFGAG
ncbi:hypothetical protein [Nocardia sp. NPDC050793]|uniref:hypothetical protein n=1 Tax=Nocardia sp. NPDC050793 TaxID=3155159 RepID=UPI00340955A8